MTNTNQTQALAKKDETAVEFIPVGAVDKIKLTVAVIQNLIAVRTRSGKTCSSNDAMKFLMLCRAKKLDPFSGDAYLIGYESKDGSVNFSLITAHQAYLKRAELHPEFDGMRSGIIVQVEDGKIMDLESDFHTDDQQVVGGWATVQFKTRKVPITRRVRLKRFQKPYGVWQEDPAGMIVKCAEADALRSAFPTMLGGLYMREEIDISKPQESREAYDIPASRLVDVQSEPARQTNGNNQREQAPPSDDTTLDGPSTPQNELAALMKSNGYKFDQFVAVMNELGTIKDADSLTGYDDIKEADAKRILKAKIGLLAKLQEMFPPAERTLV